MWAAAEVAPADDAQVWALAEIAPADDTQVWAPAVGHHLQYGCDIFGSSCSLQPYVVPANSYFSGGQQQLVEYNYYNYYAAAAQLPQHHDPDPMETYIDPDLMETYMNKPHKLFLERVKEFQDDTKLVKTKMHRYPPSIQALGDWCTVPKFVAIGPYYHDRGHLKMAEKMKHLAASYCVHLYIKINKNSDLSVRDLYGAVVCVITAEIHASGLYDKDVMAGISYEDDFLPMMFYDACFLVIYILRKSDMLSDPDLYDFFEANDNDIAIDIMLLENQIPLQVVEAIMNMCTADPLKVMKKFIANWLAYGFLQDRVVRPGSTNVDWDEDYSNKAPHLLGLLRFYVVTRRRSSSKPKLSNADFKKIESIQVSAGAIELAEMGIFLTANQTMELQDMGLAKKWTILTKLSMAPLSLNDARARWLVNMAAFELCRTPDFFDRTAEFEDSAVCSYLLLLSMLLHREEDVHELRTKGILQGAGLNNNKTLEFFTSLHSLRKGRGYVAVMKEIASYKSKKRYIITVYAFVYNNWKYIIAVGSALGAFIGIIVALMNLKRAH